MEYFSRVAVCGSIKKAAEELYISQSAISKSIAELENELQCSLFDRHGKRLKLNKYGRRLLELCSEILSLTGSVHTELQKMKNGKEHKTICIDTYYPIAHDLIGRTIISKFPEIDLKVKTTMQDVDRIVRDILRGNTDIAMVVMSESSRRKLRESSDCCSVASILVAYETLTLIAPQNGNYPSGGMTIKMTNPDRLITCDTHGFINSWVDRVAQAHNHSIAYRHVVGPFLFKDMIKTGEYDFMTTSFYIMSGLYADIMHEKRMLPLTEPEAGHGIYVIYKKNDPTIEDLVHKLIEKIYSLRFQSPDGGDFEDAR